MSLKTLRQKYPEYNDLSDLELAEGFYKKHYSDMDETEYYEKMFPEIAAERSDEMLPLPEEATDYLQGRGISMSTTPADLRFKPTVEEIAESKGVSANNPATFSSRWGSSMGYNQEQKTLAIKNSLSEFYKQDIKVRTGPNTGVLEYYNPKTQSYALVDKPGMELADIGDVGGDLMVILPDIAATIAMTAYTGNLPAGLGTGAVVAGIAEFARLKIGQKYYNINEGLSNSDLIKEGTKTAAISGVAGTAGVGLGYMFKGVDNLLAGRSFHFKNSDMLSEQKFKEAMEVEKNINEVLEKNHSKEKFKVSLAKAADDPDLLSVQASFENVKRLGRVGRFREFNREEAEALNKYFDILKKGFGTNNNTTFKTGTLIKNVLENRQKKPIQEAIKKQEEAETVLTKSVFRLPDGNAKTTGTEFRSILADIGEEYKIAANKASKELDTAAGTKIINTDKIADALKILSEKEQRSLVEVSKVEGIFKPKVFNQLQEVGGKVLLSDVRETISVLGKLIRDKFAGKTTGETVDTGKLLKLQSSFLEQLNKDAGSGYVNQLENFNTLVKTNKELLDNDLMSSLTRIEVGNKLKIADEDIFLTTFKGKIGSGKAAKETYDVISRSPEALAAYKNSIYDFYKRKVITDGVPNVTKHRTFMNDYDKPLRQFFNEAEYKKISKIGGLKKYTDDAAKSLKLLETKLFRSFEGKLINSNPQEIFKKIYGPNNIGEIDQLKNILSKNPDYYKSFQRDVLTDLNEKVMTSSDKLGMKIIDPKALDNYLNGKGGERGYRAALEKIFGKEYVNNLDTLNKALQITSRKPPATGVEGMVGNFVTDIIRARLGQFTQPGRLFTAGRRIFASAANRVIANALLNPQSLSLLMQLRKLSRKSKYAAAILGKLGGSIFILPDEGDIEFPETQSESNLFNQEKDAERLAALPMRGAQNVAPLPSSPNINPAAFSVASIDQTGLTASENAFLDEQEKVMKLRERGIA